MVSKHIILSTVKRVVNCIFFQSLKHALVACNEVKESKKFHQVLKLVLLFGNVMNSGTKLGEGLGYDISFLAKLSQTKDVDNKFTLMHYLAQTVEEYHPETLSFPLSLMHTEDASRVNFDQVSTQLTGLPTRTTLK